LTWFRTLLVIATFLTGARAAGIRVPPHVVPGVGVNIVAHQDDDLFFMNPDILNAVVRGQTQVTVFLTAGNVRADDIYFMHGRESGAMDAYSANPHPVDFPNAYQDPAGGAYDHSDHYYSGLFARAALRGYVKSRPHVPKPQNWIYNGYNISDGHLTPLAEPIPTYKKWMYYYYALDDYRAWPNGSPMSFTDLYPDGSQRGDWTYYQQATRLPVPTFKTKVTGIARD
jgi:GlcNAc-PI de-N-acetylase